MPSTGTPSVRRATALPPHERRAAIIEAIAPLLVEHGEMVTTRQIARAAGVAEGTIFSVFADKDELLLASLRSALDMGVMDQALDAIDRAKPFETQLIEATIVIQQRVEDVWSLVSNLGSRLVEQAAQPLTDSVALISLFEAERSRLRVEPDAAARLLRALTLSMTHPMLAGQSTSARDIVAFFLRGTERAR